MPELQVYHEANPAYYDLLAAGLAADTAAQIGPGQGNPLVVMAGQEPDLAGGLWGSVLWGWLKVELLWVHQAARGQGLGRQLLRRAEQEAVRGGARHAHLSTFSFQALEFCQKEGYEVFGQLPDFPVGHTRCYLKKQLG